MQNNVLTRHARRFGFALAIGGSLVFSNQAFAQTCPIVQGTFSHNFNFSMITPSNGQVFTAPNGGKAEVQLKANARLWTSMDSFMSAACVFNYYHPSASVAIDGSPGYGYWDYNTGLISGKASLRPGTYSVGPYGFTNLFNQAPVKRYGDTITIKVVEAPPGPGPIQGNIDGISMNNGRPILNGWACDKNVATPIEVHVYMGAASGNAGASYGTATRTSILREAAVSSVCGTKGVAHGFAIDLSGLQAAHAGKSIFVHGISTSGGNNLAIAGSGNFKLPSNLGPIQGNIDGFSSANGRTYLQGWACDKNVAKSIDVHVYVGGAAGSGQLATSLSANANREAAVSQACGTNGVGHGFSIDVTNVPAQFVGKPIYIHGISTSGGDNALIGNSGTFQVPASR